MGEEVDTSSNWFMIIGILALSTAEMIKGIAYRDIDLLRDCLNSMLLVGTLVLSTKANSLSVQLD